MLFQIYLERNRQNIILYAVKIHMNPLSKILVRAIRESGISRHALTKRAGLSKAALDGLPDEGEVTIGSGGFNPRLATVERLVNVLGLDLTDVLPPRPVIATYRHDQADSINWKGMLRDEVARGVDGQIGQVARYCDFLIGEHGVLREADLDFRLLDTVAPDCAIHVVAIGDTKFSHQFVRWGKTPEYRGGASFEGVTVGEFNDAALADCFDQDIHACSKVTWPLFAAVRRKAFWQETESREERLYIRLMLRLVSSDDISKALVVSSRQKSPPAIKLVRRLAGGIPH